MTGLAPGSVPRVPSTSRVTGPIWRRAGLRAETGPGPASDPDRARGGGARGRPLGVDPQLLGPDDPGHLFGKHRARRPSRPIPSISAPWTPAWSPTGRGGAGSATWPWYAANGAKPSRCPTASWRACSFRPTGFNWREFRRPRRQFQPLVREVESSGVVARTATPRPCSLEIPARQAPWIAEGQTADIACADLAGPRCNCGTGAGRGASFHRRLGIPPRHDRRDRSAARPSRRDDRRRPHQDTDGRARAVPLAAGRSAPIVRGRAQDCLCLP